MPSSKYISLASSRLSSLKDYVSQHRDDLGGGSPSQNLKQWAGQKIRRSGGNTQLLSGNEEISLFPGWAVRRYDATTAEKHKDPRAYTVDVFVSGYATSRRSPELATRSQRAFLRIAKTFASLPKLPSEQESPSSIPLTTSTENLLASVTLPPRPTEISEDYDVQVLEQHFLNLNTEDLDAPESPTASIHSNSSAHTTPAIPSSSTGHSLSAEIRKLHANLEMRIQPFWSTALTSRTVRIHILAPSPSKEGPEDQEHPPLASADVQTDANGFFSNTFTVLWEHLCSHPGTTHLAAGDACVEHDIFIVAEMLPPLPPLSPPSALSRSLHPNATLNASPTTTSTLSIPLTHSPLRVISDIDDTVKLSNIVSGARAVFKNVFVKELHETTIPGMGEWYSSMWRRGVRFHYVSNGPFELLPVVSEFLQVSQLPSGSIRLKSYAGRSLFNGLLSAPATRKRAGVFDILRSFPSSQFILVGDTGEQDLELYASLASEQPAQIVAVFVRDVNSVGIMKAVDGVQVLAGMINSIDDPTGARVLTDPELAAWIGSSSAVIPGGNLVSEPDTYSTTSIATTNSSSSSSTTTTTTTSSSLYTPPLKSTTSSSSSKLSRTGGRPSLSPSEPEKKRQELQTRVWKARMQIPAHIPLRIFRRPEECVEAHEILEKLNA